MVLLTISITLKAVVAVLVSALGVLRYSELRTKRPDEATAVLVEYFAVAGAALSLSAIEAVLLAAA